MIVLPMELEFFLKTMWEEEGFEVIYQPKNKGKGAALRTGFEIAKGEVIIIQDADLEYNPKDYPVLLGAYS